MHKVSCRYESRGVRYCAKEVVNTLDQLFVVDIPNAKKVKKVKIISLSKLLDLIVARSLKVVT